VRRALFADDTPREHHPSLHAALPGGISAGHSRPCWASIVRHRWRPLMCRCWACFPERFGRDRKRLWHHGRGVPDGACDDARARLAESRRPDFGMAGGDSAVANGRRSQKRGGAGNNPGLGKSFRTIFILCGIVLIELTKQ
jgi:hypothetical protein